MAMDTTPSTSNHDPSTKRKRLLASRTDTEEMKIITEDDNTSSERSEDDSFSSLSSFSSSASTTSSHKKKKKQSTKAGKKRRKKTKKRSKKRGKKDHGDHKAVTFGTTQVLEFNYTIGASSVTERGPPVGLGSKLIRSKTLSVSKFEKRRQEQDEDELTPDARRRILKQEGFSNEEIQQADLESTMVRIGRKQSVLNMKWDDWHAKKERVGRRMRRWTSPNALYRKGTQLLRRSAPAATE